MYIDSELIAYPCSFGIDNQKYMVNLKNHTIKEAWESEKFTKFRTKSIGICDKCDKLYCYNCRLDLGIDVCGMISKY
jgi:radical SAM protein with 4Fe4S-binding SPASM domain